MCPPHRPTQARSPKEHQTAEDRRSLDSQLGREAWPVGRRPAEAIRLATSRETVARAGSGTTPAECGQISKTQPLKDLRNYRDHVGGQSLTSVPRKYLYSLLLRRIPGWKERPPSPRE